MINGVNDNWTLSISLPWFFIYINHHQEILSYTQTNYMFGTWGLRAWDKWLKRIIICCIKVNFITIFTSWYSIIVNPIMLDRYASFPIKTTWKANKLMNRWIMSKSYDRLCLLNIPSRSCKYIIYHIMNSDNCPFILNMIFYLYSIPALATANQIMR